jgi:WD40 repeat protein
LGRTVDSAKFPAQGSGADDEAGSDDLGRTVDSAEFPAQGSGADDEAGSDDLGRTLDSVDVPDTEGESVVRSSPTRHGMDQTVEFEAAAEDHATAGTIDLSDDGGPTPTVDSVEQAPAGDEPADERGLLATMDSSDVEVEVTRKLTAIWGGEVDQLKPGMTIKGQTSRTVHEGSTLVIHTRAFRAAEAEKPRAVSERADYDLIRLLGEGGMGMVYSARQASIDRTVAIKMLKRETAADQTQRRKFLSEAVITGDLDHPNIVPIYDLGTNHEGALFYSMKRVQGTPWDKQIRELKLPENLDILMKSADAVAFAHSRGVVHRDLKPENIMLGDFGEVLVMDWGLAMPTSNFKKSRNVGATTSMGGTPAYMAPEMALGPIDRIGEASDIYLLGAILYECVAGYPPHAGKNVTKCLMAAARNEIRPTEATGELVDIARKAMSTKPEDRYGSVLEFQSAIRAYQSHSESIALATRAAEDLVNAQRTDDYQDFAQAVFGFREAIALWNENERAHRGLLEAKLAYAGSAYGKGDYDLGASLLDADEPDHAALLTDIRHAQQEREARQRRLKTAKRVVVGLVALIFLLITGGFLAVNYQRKLAIAARDRAEEARRDAEVAREQERLAREDAERAEEKERSAKEAALAAQREERRAKEAALAAKEQEAKARRAEEEAKLQALAAKEQEAKARRAAELAREQEAKAKAETEYQAYIALIGLAAAKIEENAFDAARELLQQCKPELRNWEWGRLTFLCQQEVRSLEADFPLEAIDLSADGQRLVAGGWNGLVKIWSLSTNDPPLVIPHSPTSFVNAVAFSPDGRLVATGSSDQGGGYLRLWDAETGQLVKRLDGHEDTVLSVVFSPEGRRLLTSSYDHTARLWDIETGQLVRTFVGHDWWVWSAAFSPDGQRIVTASQDGSAIVWSVETGEPLAAPFTGHRLAGSQTPVYTAVFSPDGRIVASGGLDNRVLIWDPDELQPFDYQRAIAGRRIPAQQLLTLDGHKAAVRCVAFSRDGTRILSGSQDNAVIVWDTDNGEMIKSLRGHDGWVRSCRFWDNDRFAVSGSHDGKVKFWDIDGYQEARVLRGHVLDSHQDAVLGATFSPDGRQVVTASRDRTAKSWDVETGQEIQQFREGHEFTVAAAVFFPDGKRLLTTAVDNTTRIWDVTTGAELVELRLQGTGLHGTAAVSHDGRWILTGSQRPDETEARQWAARLWDADTGKLVHQLRGHQAEVTAVAFSPDDVMLVSGDRNGRCVLWDRLSGREIARFWDDAQINSVAFLPGGRRLLTANNHKAVRQWNIPEGTEDKQRVLNHPASVVSMAVSGEGRVALTACGDGRVRMWDVQQAREIRSLDVTGGKMAFAQNLRRAMKDFNWNENQLADRCRLKASEISDLLAAKIEASPEMSRQLATALEIQPDDLWKTIFSVAISPDGSLGLTVAADDRIVQLWNLQDGSQIRYPVTPERLGPFLDFGGKVLRGMVWSAAFAPQGDRVVTVGGDSARLWDLNRELPARSRELMSFSPHGAIASAHFSHDGRYLVTGSWDNSARIWDVQNGQVIRRLGRELDRPQDEHRGRVNTAVFSPDDRIVLTASDDGTAKLWSTQDWSLLRTLSGHTGAVLDAVFSPDGTRVLTSSRDKTARLWDAATGRSLAVLAGHEWAVLDAAFSADGRWVVTGSADDAAIVWRLEDDGAATAVHTLRGHTASVTSVAFSPEENPSRILTGSEDYTAILWDATTGQEILTLKGHTQEVTSVAFSPDGKLALTGSRDGSAIVWLTTDWQRPEEQLAAGRTGREAVD